MRYIFIPPAITGSGMPGVVSFWDRPTGGIKYTDLWYVDGDEELSLGMVNGLMFVNGTGTDLAPFAGPDGITSIYLQKEGSGNMRWNLIADHGQDDTAANDSAATIALVSPLIANAVSSEATSRTNAINVAVASIGTIVGPTGAAGAKGDTGSTGPTGPAGTTISSGSASVAAALLGVTQNITVTLSPTQPDVNYTPVVTFSGTALLGTADYTVTAQTTTTVTVAIRAGIAISAGGTIRVVAIR